MRKTKFFKLIIFVLGMISLVVATALNLVAWSLNSHVVSIIFLILNAIAILCISYGYFSHKNTIFKLFIVLGALLVVGYMSYYLIIKFGVLEHINSISDIKTLILKYRKQGILIYTLINFLQVTFVPLPSSVTILTGAMIFGPFLAFVFASLGIMLGSILAFFIGRVCSKPILCWIFGKNKVEKYETILADRTKLILFLTLFLPFFPDDLICMLAGITNIKFEEFLIIALIARSFGIACLSYFGSGQLIPFSGWGIIAWIVIGVIVFITLLIVILNRKKIIRGLRYKKQ